jgi:hypothetical protein
VVFDLVGIFMVAVLDSLGAFSDFHTLDTGKASIRPVSNARVATGTFLSLATVNVPFFMAWDAHLRDAVSNARRHGVEQNLCGLPPVARVSNVASHQLQFIN